METNRIGFVITVLLIRFSLTLSSAGYGSAASRFHGRFPTVSKTTSEF
jgi:hypothetical protein